MTERDFRGRETGLAATARNDTPNAPHVPRPEEDGEAAVHRSVEHVQGPTEISCGADELVVVCVVRNGRPYMKTFVDHYLSLGVRHVVFLDNGSTDGTVEALDGRENVTVLRTDLPFKTYQMAMKRYLMRRFCEGRWALCVDTDELFDYPYSDVVNLGDFLRYLTENSYTAVVAQMLDMFPEEPLTETSGGEDEPFEERHRFYDVSNVVEMGYQDNPRACGPDNVVSSGEISSFRNGIQETVFGLRPLLTKHPLVFMDDQVEPVDESAHRISHARIADLTCVLYHYKFLDGFHEHVRQAVRMGNYPNRHGKYEKLLEVLEENPAIRIKTETASELQGVSELVDAGFLVVSKDYLRLVEDSERESERRGSDQDPHTLMESRLEARKAAREKGREAGSLRRRLRALEAELASERGVAIRLRKRIRELIAEVEKLQRQMADMRNSRSWRLLNALGRVRARVIGR